MALTVKYTAFWLLEFRSVNVNRKMDWTNFNIYEAADGCLEG